MLKKLLKHELKYVWRIWWILALVMVGLSIGGGLTQGVIERAEQSSIYVPITLFSTLLLLLCILFIIGSVIGLYIMLLVRFHNHMFTDEGYLTFTLPVSRRDVLLSKTLNAVIWTVAHTVLIGICIDLILIFSNLSSVGEVSFVNLISYSIGELFEIAWNTCGGWTIAFSIEIPVLIVIGIFFSTCLIQLCITIAATVAKKGRLIVGIGIYYLASTVLSFVSQIIAVGFTALMASGLSTVLAGITDAQGYGLLALLLLIGIAILSTFTLFIYFLNRNILERKLNLA